MKVNLLFTLLLTVGSTIGFGQLPVNMELRLDSSIVECGQGELILKSIIENTSENQLVINRRLFFRTMVFFKNGKSRTVLGHAGLRTESDYLVLFPTERVESSRNIDLEDEFFQKPGKYTVSVAYVNYSRDKFRNLPVWRGRIASNEVSFEIAECASAEEPR